MASENHLVFIAIGLLCQGDSRLVNNTICVASGGDLFVRLEKLVRNSHFFVQGTLNGMGNYLFKRGQITFIFITEFAVCKIPAWYLDSQIMAPQAF